VKILFLMIMGMFITNENSVLFDFNTEATSGAWSVVNDVVMGGLSQSNMILNNNGTATFRGSVSLENNGGFASVRADVNNIDGINYLGVKVFVKGDGKIYNLRFRTSNNFDGYAYQAKIETEKDIWKEFIIPFENFIPTYRGYTVSNKPALESKNITQIGILIADKQKGDFELLIDWIKLYR
jgi:monofunctional biosynthetic peptidoglycan transglycosylase